MLTCWFVARWRQGALGTLVAGVLLAGPTGCTQPQTDPSGDESRVPPVPESPRWRAPAPVDLPPPKGMPPASACRGPGLQNASGWCWENPLPQGNTIYGSWASGANDVWMVGAAGTILRWDGEVLSLVPNAATKADELHGIWGSGPDDIWVVGGGMAFDANITQHWDGKSWQVIKTPATTNLYGVWGSGPKDVWSVGSYRGAGALFHWDGSSWQVDSTSTSDLRAIWGTRTDDIWAVGIGGQILHWNGARWQKAASPTTSYLTQIWGSGPRDVWAGGSPLIHFDGATWAKTPDTNRSPNALGGLRADDLWLADGIRLVRGAPGAWMDVVGGDAAQRIFTLLGVGANEMWGAGYAGKLFRWVPAGPRVMSGGTPSHIYSIWGASPSDLWAASIGVMLHGDGLTWSPVSVGESSQIFSVRGTTANDVWAVTCGGSILHFDGARWTRAATVPGVCLRGVWAGAANDAWAVGSGSTLQHWDGTSWRPQPVGAGIEFDDVWGTGPMDVWFAGTSSGTGIVMHWDGVVLRTAWSTSSGLRGVFGTARNDVWVAGGVLGHYDGITWKLVPGPAPVDVLGLWGGAPDDFWAAGFFGDLMHWDGTAWSRRRSGTNVNLNGVFGFGKNVRIHGDNGTILSLP